MKVLRLIGSLDPSHGGPPVSSLNSCIALQRAGAETTFAFPMEEETPGVTTMALAHLQEAGVEIKTFPFSSTLGRRADSWGVSQSLAHWIRQNHRRFDLVHCHGAWQMATLLSTLGVDSPPLVLTPHESMTRFDIAQSSSAATGVIKAWLRRYYARRIDLFIMSSHMEARTSLPTAMASSDRVAIIPHPVFDETEIVSAGAPNRTTNRDLTLGYLGRLHQKKNVDVILRTLHQIPAAVSLSVAGAGPERDTLKSLAASLGLDNRINWLGFVQGADKEAFFDAIDILLMPSDFECFGMAAAEAMARGIPVFASPDTGIGEIIRDHGGGEIIRPDANAMRAVIESLSQNRGRLAQMGTKARETARQKLSFRAYGDAAMQYFERLLAIRKAA